MRTLVMLLMFTSLLSACGGGGGGGGGTSISVDKSTIEFVMDRGGDLPAAQIVTASFKGDGVVVGYPNGVQPLSELQIITVDNTDTRARFALSVVESSLPPGEYKTVLRFLTGRITAAGDPTDIRQADVQVRITIRNALVVRPIQTPLQFSGDLEKTIDASHYVNILAQGINWTVTSSQAWVKFDKTSGRGDGFVSVGVDNLGLPVGESKAEVSIRDTDSGVVRTFQLLVTNRLPHVMQVGGSGELAFQGANGAPPLVAAQRVYALSAMQSATWTIRSATSWLRPTISSDRTQPVVTIQTDISGMKSGDYSGSFVIEAALGGESVQLVVPVSLRLHMPALQQVTNTIAFSAYASERVSEQISFALNTGQNFHRVRITASGPGAAALGFVEWVDVSGDASAVTISLDATKLPPGNSSALLRIQGSVSGEPVSAEIPVSIATTPNRLVAARQAIAFLQAPDRQRLQVTVSVADASDFGAHEYDVDSSAGWLTTEGIRRSGRSLLVRANPQGLSEGFHEAHLTLKSVAPGFSGVEKINVGIYVTHASVAAPLALALSGVDSARLVADPLRPYVYLSSSTHTFSTLIRRIHIYTGETETVAESPLGSSPILVPSHDGKRMFSLMVDEQLGEEVIRVYSLPDFRVLDTFSGLGGDRLSQAFSYARPAGQPMLLFGDFSALDLETNELHDTEGDDASYLACGGSLTGAGALTSADGQYAVSQTGCAFHLDYAWTQKKVFLSRINLSYSASFRDAFGWAAISRDGSRYYLIRPVDGSSTVMAFNLLEPTRRLSGVTLAGRSYGRVGVDDAGGMYAVGTRLSPARWYISFFDSEGVLKEHQETEFLERDEITYAPHADAVEHSADQARFIWVQQSHNAEWDALVQVREYPE